jgi:hypothetical protein
MSKKKDKQLETILVHLPSYRDPELVPTIKDALAGGKEILIRAFQLPIINRELLKKDLLTKTNLNELFETTRQDLKNKIEEILL